MLEEVLFVSCYAMVLERLGSFNSILGMILLSIRDISHLAKTGCTPVCLITFMLAKSCLFMSYHTLRFFSQTDECS